MKKRLTSTATPEQVSVNQWLVRLERLFHPKLKEFIAKSLVYYFALKEYFEFQKERYTRTPHLYDSFKRDQILNIAHRGFSARYPENTLLAFHKALDAGADMIELDVQLSRDGEVVVCHDPELGRLTGLCAFVADLDWSQLQTQDVGAWFGSDFVGLHMPSLSQVFESLGPDSYLNIEIKHEASSFLNDHTERKIIALIRAHQMDGRVVISAFNPLIVNRIRKLAPEISSAYLITQTLTRPLIYLLGKIRARYIHVDFHYLSPQKVRDLHRAGVQVLSYTLNEVSSYQQAEQWGVKGCFTDHPDRLRDYLTASVSATS